MTWYEALSVAGALASGVNTILILQINRHKDGQVAKLTAALLHTAGETRAAMAVEPERTAPKAKVTPLPQDRNRQVGLTPR